MRRIATGFELVVAALVTCFGAYLLFEGTSNKIESGTGVPVILGGLFLAAGIMSIFFVAKSFIWHWQMIRQVEAEEELDAAQLLGSVDQTFRIAPPQISPHPIPNGGAEQIGVVLGAPFQSLSALDPGQTKAQIIVVDVPDRRTANAKAAGARN